MRQDSSKPQTQGPQSEAGGGIWAQDVTVTYRNGHTALRHASFEIPRGTITALVGVNGAGKSSMMRMLSGEVWPTNGDITREHEM